MSKLLDGVFSLAEPIARANGCRVYETEFKKEGADFVLRVFLYSRDGINLDQCEKVSRALGAELDRVDPIEQSYCLEVSSPGLERALSRDWHFAETIGERISVRLYSAADGRKTITGILSDYSGGKIRIKTDEGEDVSIEKEKAARVNAAPFFD